MSLFNMLTYAINIPFHILRIKIPVCWDEVLFNSIMVSAFWGSMSLTLRTEEVHTSKTFVRIYQAIWCHIPEDSVLGEADISLILQIHWS
jgi:hypothetical protein